jgi:hypothetical protein
MFRRILSGFLLSKLFYEHAISFGEHNLLFSYRTLNNQHVLLCMKVYYALESTNHQQSIKLSWDFKWKSYDHVLYTPKHPGWEKLCISCYLVFQWPQGCGYLQAVLCKPWIEVVGFLNLTYGISIDVSACWMMDGYL